MFAGKKSAQIREILISESAWEEMTCLFAPSLDKNVFFPPEITHNFYDIENDIPDQRHPDGALVSRQVFEISKVCRRHIINNWFPEQSKVL